VKRHSSLGLPLRSTVVSSCDSEATDINGKTEFTMIGSWKEIVVGSLPLHMAAALVISHYRRERQRERVLRRMEDMFRLAYDTTSKPDAAVLQHR